MIDNEHAAKEEKGRKRYAFPALFLAVTVYD